MGSDDALAGGIVATVGVSIHAPAWGATFIFRISESFFSRFQSTLPHGERLEVWPFRLQQFQFQSTLPHGERQIWWNGWPYVGRFNPRSRMGSDAQPGVDFQKTMAVSIHAPAWGATGAGDIDAIGIHRFNPRSRMGSDNAADPVASELAGFNPRSRMGSDAKLSQV